MNIKVLKSNEIDEHLWENITLGFNEAFDKDKKPENFIDYYHNTILNYSYHALAFSDSGELVGSTTIIPHYYIVNKQKYLFGLSGGTFVKKKFRKDIFVYKDMMDNLISYSKKQGLKLIYGVPNKNSLKYTTKFLKFEHVLNLDYYVVPFKLGNILKLPASQFFNFISFFIFSSLVNFGSLFSNFNKFKSISKPIHIDFSPLFIEKRFKKDYKVIKNDDFFLAYKVSLEDNIRTAFLLEYRDGHAKTYKSLIKAIKIIKKTENVDILVYIGTLSHKSIGLFKLPKNKQPQELSLTIKLLCNDKKFNTFIKNKNNWDFSLVNYDVR